MEQEVFVVVQIIDSDCEIQVIVQPEFRARIDDEILVEALTSVSDRIVVGEVCVVAAGEARREI